MVDTLDSGSSTLKKCGGSNPLSRTNITKHSRPIKACLVFYA